MGIPAQTYVQMQNDGIVTFEDLLTFKAEDVKRIADGLRRPTGRVPDPAAGQANGPPAGATMPTPPFPFPIKSQIRLEQAIEMAHFYDTIGRPFSAQNMMYDPIIKNFKELWDVLKAKKSKDQPEVPKLGKGISFVKWIESFKDHTYQCVGARLVPLAAVIRDVVEVAATCPPLAVGQPYSELYGSVMGDLIHRSSHSRGNFKENNSEVYFKIEEATRNTTYQDSIAPFKKALDGRGAYLALKAQYAGKDKWDAIIAKHKDILATRVWKGNSSFTLESFIQQHRTAYIQMAAAAEHVPHQLPDGYTRVTDLLSKIECDDAALQAAMANIENDDGEDGKRHNFEDAASFLLPKDPVVKRLNTAGSKRASASISDVNAESSGSGAKPGIGHSGVHLRYHTNEEYYKLSASQKKELREYRALNPDVKKSGGKKPKKKAKRAQVFAAAVEKAVNKHLEERSEQVVPPAAAGQVSTAETHARNLIQAIVGSKGKTGNVSAIQIEKDQSVPAAGQPNTDVEASDDGKMDERQVTFRGAVRRAVSRRYHA